MTPLTIVWAFCKQAGPLTIDDSGRAQLKLQATRAVAFARVERRRVGRRGQSGRVRHAHSVAATGLPPTSNAALASSASTSFDISPAGQTHKDE
jgi:hypothetical protein